MEKDHRKNTPERKHFVTTKSGNFHIRPKLLYTGQLQPSCMWKEEPHSHDFLEVMFVMRGSGEATVGGETRSVAAGDLLVYNPHVLHGERSDSLDPFQLAFFGVSNIALKGLPENCLLAEGQAPVIATGGDREVFFSLFSSLLEESECRRLYADGVADCFVTAILLKILRIHAYGNEEYAKINQSYLDAKKYIDENYRSLSGIEEVCKTLYISKYYLNHLFKEYSGKTPLKYVIEKRMEHAKELLAHTDLPIAEIAVRCGYAEFGSFLKTFKNVEGMTPSAYREKIRL